MTDLLDQEAVDDFKSALRDVTDTFFRDPVVLRRASGEEVPLLAGLKPADDGSGHGELRQGEAGSEAEQRYQVSFDRGYLAEQSLVDAGDELLIGYDDELLIGGRAFALVAIADRARFRGAPLLVVLEAAR